MLLFFYRLAFTDLILARGDTFAYFYAYWHARDTALLAGQLPLWTPDLFMGVPLLANSQLGTYYPPNWLTIRLTPPDAVRVSILLHIGWTLGGAYLLTRRALTLDRVPALTAAIVFALGGHIGAHVEQINQLQGLSWLPWLFLLLHRALDQPLRFTPLLAVALALQFLSGHTQTVFITGVGLGVYGLLSLRPRFILILMAAVIGAGLLASPQLLPTLELTQLSNRRGGFNPNQATAFSFSPFVIGRGLLPSYDSLIFGEYIAYPGVIALGLALIGLLTRRPKPPVPDLIVDDSPSFIAQYPTKSPLSLYEVLAFYRDGRGGWMRGFQRSARRRRPPIQSGGEGKISPRVVWAVIAFVGLFLALGVYNPLYWWLASLPGFNLFRVPARWLALFALGAAMLAGMGVQVLIERRPIHHRLVAAVGAALVALMGLSTLATRTPELVPMTDPTISSFVGWITALALLIGVLIASRLRRLPPAATRLLPLLVLVSVLVELFAAAHILPYNDLTTPESYSAPRFTVDQLQVYGQRETPPGRILSISQLYFDPGDRAALEARYARMGLSSEAVRNAFVAIKMHETLSANLPLVWGIPSIDGFDGGLLPTGYYTAFTSLLLPDDAFRTIDGRLREILARESCRGACIPSQRWLNLTSTRYLITDKIYDLWHEDIAYDTQFNESLEAGASLVIPVVQPFESTAVDVLYTCPSVCAAPAVSIAAEGSTLAAEAAEQATAFQHIRLTADEPFTPESLEITANEVVTLLAVTLVDTRTGDFAQLAFAPWTRVLSSDIKLYENSAALPRAFVVHQWHTVADHEWGTEDALAMMRDAAFDPAETATIAEGYPDATPPLHTSEPGTESSTTITRYEAERIDIAASSDSAGLLVLTDAYYPGWTATLNGQPAPILRADTMFRAVRIPAGESTITFAYRPAWLAPSLMLGGAAWAGVIMLVVWLRLKRR